MSVWGSRTRGESSGGSSAAFGTELCSKERLVPGGLKSGDGVTGFRGIIGFWGDMNDVAVYTVEMIKSKPVKH